MNKKETDISLIGKYRNGELDAKAMHRLERRAQDDPFLMDALEGYENSKGDQQEQLNQLSARLQERIHPKEKRIIPWRYMAIAATVLVCLTIGGFWLFNNHQANERPVAVNIQKPAGQAPVVQQDIVETKTDTTELRAGITTPAPTKRVRKFNNNKNDNTTASAVAASIFANAEVKNNDADTAAKDTATPLNEMIVMGYAAQRKKEQANTIAAVKPEAKKKSVLFNDQLLQGKVEGVTLNPAKSSPAAKDNLYNQAYLSKNVVIGRIIARDDGLPLPGATVKVAGSDKATQTDVEGRFKLPVDSSKSELVVNFIGYQQLKVKVNDRDSLKTIAMVPNTNSLNEVVVTRYSAKNNDEDALLIDSRPKTGWSSFRKYLKENAVSPDGKAGIVKLSFSIDQNGTIADIKVMKGLSPATDQKAQDLIMNGPPWAGSSSGRTEKVTVRIKFGR